ncbi:hypothetical protein F4677DRAFT_278704 [Hypoxylon crocopeplum]|nr:hypothetical protein F4677DRAFT_278704 [Hypoxylon crocopeplum]
MKTDIPGDVLLFAGQGSKQHLFDRDAIHGLEKRLGGGKEIFEQFLQRCQEAFRIECHNLSSTEQTILSDDTTPFLEDAEAFLLPPKPFLSNPVIETIALYVRQVLELIAFGLHSDVRPRIVEVTGVCTGLIPAILAAASSSFDSDEFLDTATDGFRLVFLVGLRSALFCRDMVGEQGKDSAWVLSTFGWPASDLDAHLSEFHNKRQSGDDYPLRVSAIFDDDVLSLTGPDPILEEFRSRIIPPNIQCRVAHVHGYYHGGTRMEGVVEELLSDIKRRHIDFPTWDMLRAPVRLSTTGTSMTTGVDCQSLLETAIRSIFVDMCDWKRTREELFDEVVRRLEHDLSARSRIICLGPGARSLVQSTKGVSTHTRLEIIRDLSDLGQEDMSESIAIVGLSVNYPSAKGKEEFWDMLEKGKSAVSEIPSWRFDASHYSSPDASSNKATRKLATKYGNFLEDPFQFDAAHFNISPREAKSMDPQQRVLLQAALDALDDSGYAPNSTPSFQKDSFGVYVGVATGDYVDNLREEIDVYYSPGTLRAFLSGRISYAFGFHGPSMVVDTACSSSLVAIYQACQALRSGECTAALAGGVNIISSPDMYIGLSRAHFLSPTGQCKPFDSGADGYCRAEGCGLVVLKKLSQAIEEGDHIYGVVRGIGINQCGTAKSITHPDKDTQAALFRQVLSSSRTDPDSINVAEAHGTGTQAGDYSEVCSLNATFGSRPATDPLYLCAIKGNIGHAEAASGIAGLAKLLLMMQKQKIPPQASFKVLNPRLTDGLQKMVIPTQLAQWKPSPNGLPRRALLNNFGAAGSNAALIIEEYQPGTRDYSEVKKLNAKRSCHILNLSAKNERALESLKKSFISYIESHPEVRIEDLCYTANARRQEYAGYRLSATGSDPSQLLVSLNQTKPIRTNTTGKSCRKTVFLFSGQGHAQKGMGAEILSTVPGFRHIVDKCDRVLSQNGFPTVAPFLSDSPGFELAKGTKDEIIVTQCALFVLEYALANTWMRWGLVPDIVLGHSIGEYAAMAIAGTLDMKDALLLVAKRAELIGTKCVPGMSGMVSCRSTADAITALLSQGDQKFPGITMACLNSREDIVVAGPVEPLTRFVDHCTANGIKSRQLQVPYGFHSAAMDPILEELESCSSSITRQNPVAIVGSSLRGRLLDPYKQLEAEYFVRHTREPVKFYSAIEDIERSFPEAELHFIEIGPSPTTEPMIRKIIKEAPYTFLPSLRPTEKSWHTLANSLCSLFQSSRPVNWREVYHGSSAKFLTSTPKYPLSTSQHYIPFREFQLKPDDGARDDPRRPSFEFLGLTEPSKPGFTTSMVSLSKYIKAHTVGGVPLCPASVLMEVALEAVSITQGTLSCGFHLFEDICFEKPLVYAEHMGSEFDLRTDLDTTDNKEIKFSCSSRDQLHCAGHIIRKSPNDVADIFARKEAFVKRQRRTFHADSSAAPDSFSPKTIYQVIFPRIVSYDEPFLTLKQLAVSESRLEGYGTFQLEASTLHDKFVCPPPFADTLLHAAGFIANIYVPTDVACICSSIERAMLPPTEKLGEGEMTVYCNLTDVGHSIIADSYVMDSNEKLIAFIEGSCFKKIPLRSFHSHLSRLIREPAREPARSSPPIKAPTPTHKKPALDQSSHIETTIQSIIRESCGVSLNTSSSITLLEAGIDSLMLIEITQSIRNQLPYLEVDEASLERCSTLKELVATVSGAFSQDSYPKIPTPDLTRGNSPKTPVVSFSPPPSPNGLGATSPMESLLFETCGIQIVDGMKNLALGTLGVDSLLSIELADELQGRFGLTIDDSKESISELTFHRLEALFRESFLASKSSSKSSDSQPSTEAGLTDSDSDLEAITDGNFQRTIQRQTRGTPKCGVYLFHDGSGHCSMYSRMTDLNRSINGIYSQDPLSSAPKAERLEDLAALYIKQTNLINEQEVILGGWSFGGVLAFEVSRQLRRLGRVVKGVILIDSPPPVNHKALPREVISYVVDKKDSTETKNVSAASKQVRNKLDTNFQHHAMLLQNYQPQPLAGDVPCMMLKCSQTMDTEALCNVAYPWLSDESFRAKAIGQWEQLVGRRIPVLEVACNHFQVFDSQFVREVSEKLKLACDVLESPTA